MTATIGLVGFGEAGASIAGGLVEHGIEVVATDVRLASDAGVQLRDVARERGVVLVDDAETLAGRAPVILSFVTSSAALAVAESLAPHVGPDHLVIDANSTSPARVQEVGRILEGTGALVCDVAVMSAVPPHRHRVPMLASGPGAQRFVELDVGFNVQVVDGDLGAASAIKMLRSSLIKGLEALLLEFGLAARTFGATGEVLRSITGTLPSEDWEELMGYLLTRTVKHAERRGHELEEVADMFRTAGIEPMVASAAAQRLLAAGDLGLAERVPDGMAAYDELLEIIAAAADGDPR
jgi:3-hydroxyisobutyrate dehydrogenase-like beta-hydroxyacid dehydrogenase